MLHLDAFLRDILDETLEEQVEKQCVFRRLFEARVGQFPVQGHVVPVSATVAGWRKEGNGLFNDALNTFHLRLYGVRHMVKEGRKRFI